MLTPEQKIKWAILVWAAKHEYAETDLLDGLSEPPTSEEIDAAYERLRENDYDACTDGESEMRGGTEETGLPCEWSRHYEAKAVAAQMPDGSWVGWTYWYGGGKHGEPESIEWMEDAYELTMAEEMRPVKIFAKAGS